MSVLKIAKVNTQAQSNNWENKNKQVETNPPARGSNQVGKARTFTHGRKSTNKGEKQSRDADTHSGIKPAREYD